MNKKRSWNDWPIWFALLLAVIVVYVGAYAVIATPRSRIAMTVAQGGGECGIVVDLPAECWVVYSANQRFDSILEVFFAPANYADRKLIFSRWPGEFVSKHSPPEEMLAPP